MQQVHTTNYCKKKATCKNFNKSYFSRQSDCNLSSRYPIVPVLPQCRQLHIVNLFDKNFCIQLLPDYNSFKRTFCTNLYNTGNPVYTYMKTPSERSLAKVVCNPKHCDTKCSCAHNFNLLNHPVTYKRVSLIS